MNNEELKKIDEIYLRQEKNLLVFSQVAAYLNNAPCAMTKKIMDEITNGDNSLEEYSYAVFLSNAFTEDQKLSNELLKEYYLKSVKKLNTNEYKQNPYFQKIKIPKQQIGKWNLGYQSYKPYEAFIYNDIIRDKYTEIPKIGFFDEEFSFPTVFENGVEWMAIKPNEIETMKKPIDDAFGNVLVYGLGLGYYAYMISLKDNVSSVTVVERDEEVISLFENHILPQFDNKNKIKIVKNDAYDFAKNQMSKGGYDFVFADLWHDVSDGVECYVKMKKYEKSLKNTKFSYWIEKSIISAIRVRIFDAMYEEIKNKRLSKTLGEIEHILSDEYLATFAYFL